MHISFILIVHLTLMLTLSHSSVMADPCGPGSKKSKARRQAKAQQKAERRARLLSASGG
jgi:hypothetical protein